METHTPSRLGHALNMVDGLEAAGVAIARIARRRLKPRPRPGRGATLRPGVDTPLWLALVAQIRPFLRVRGAKALLARELELDPSRVSQFFVRRTASPDAERTLQLLGWLGRQRMTLLIETYLKK